jgi:hypothetical protein
MIKWKFSDILRRFHKWTHYQDPLSFVEFGHDGRWLLFVSKISSRHCSTTVLSFWDSIVRPNHDSVRRRMRWTRLCPSVHIITNDAILECLFRYSFVLELRTVYCERQHASTTVLGEPPGAIDCHPWASLTWWFHGRRLFRQSCRRIELWGLRTTLCRRWISFLLRT